MQRALRPSFFSFFFSSSPPSLYLVQQASARCLYLRSLFLRDGHRNRSPTCCEIYTLNVGRNNDRSLLFRFSTADLYYRSGPGLYSPRNANLLYRVIRPCADRCISLPFSLSLARSLDSEPRPRTWKIDRSLESMAGRIDPRPSPTRRPMFLAVVYKRVIALIPGIS